MARILLAEDNDALCELFAAVFSSVGHELYTARNGEQALAWLGKGEFDVLIADIHLPDLNGLTLCARVREINPELASHIIFITGATDLETRALLAAMKVPYFLKPFSVKRLLDYVEHMIHVHHA